MKPINDLELKIKIANMYYKDQLTQQEIADILKISRPKVARIINDCKSDGIVKITIMDNSVHQYNLEDQLKKKYGLRYVSVVSSHSDPTQTLNDLGIVCNELLSEIIQSNVKLGLSAGSSLAGLIYRLNPVKNYQIDIYQMCGDASHQLSNCASFLTIEMAKRINGIPHAIHSPLIVNTKVLRDLLMDEPMNRNHFDSLKNLDLALVGLGRIDSILPNTSDTWYNFVMEKEELRKKNVVGDICGIFIDNNGKICDSEIQRRTIAIPPDYLYRIPCTIAVTFGKEKLQVAKAAIAGNLINALLTDEDLAYSLLEN